MTIEVFETVWDALEDNPTEAENMKLSDVFPRSADPRNLCDRLAAACNADGFAGSSALDQRAQMRLRVGETDRYHLPLLTN